MKWTGHTLSAFDQKRFLIRKGIDFLFVMNPSKKNSAFCFIEIQYSSFDGMIKNTKCWKELISKEIRINGIERSKKKVYN